MKHDKIEIWGILYKKVGTDRLKGVVSEGDFCKV
jgi:hypothetical protein